MQISKIQGIYAIMPDTVPNMAKLTQLLSEGVNNHPINTIQYRRKKQIFTKNIAEAKRIQQLCYQYQATFIINDSIDLCLEVNADGVHLGLNDASIMQARAKLGKNKIIGISCYNQLNLAKQAQSLGADYVAFGRLFPSKTKPNAVHCPLDILIQAKQQLNIPIVGIGGITWDNINQVKQTGCDAQAMLDTIYNK